MRIIGWLASGLGIIGVIVSNGLATVVWVLKISVQRRAHDLFAIPETGLERAVELTDSVVSRLGDASTMVGDIQAKASGLAAASEVDPAAAAELARALDDFVSGPYAEMRTIYAALKERASMVADTLQGLDGSIPFLSLPSGPVERLQAMDAALVEFDDAITKLDAAGADGLAQPGVVARVAERAANVQQVLDTVGGLVTEVGARMQESHDRVVESDRRIARRLTAGAAVVSVVSLFFSGLNVLLYQQGRRWSRR